MTELSRLERFWHDHQPWLLSFGYQLRPRFRQDWVPSWVTHPVAHYGKLFQREDFIRYVGIAPVMDAIRLSDNKRVMMKKIYSRECLFDYEQRVSEFVSSPDQLQSPDNHCVPVIETLRIPGDDENVILVMPQLRNWLSPRFDTIGEALDMIHQAFKGLQYLHRNGIAHRDCTGFNFMMDGSEMYPDGFHPVKQDHNVDFTGSAFQKYTRTQRPPKYYWIDFGLSVPFHESDHEPRAPPIYAGDKSAPELQHLFTTSGPHDPVDPFPTDIYYLGNMVRMYFTEGSPEFSITRRKYGFGFLKPLVQLMVQNDPTLRPTVDQCVFQLEQIIQAQSSWTLRSQVWHSTDNPLGFIYRFFPHWARRVVYIITGTPAIPSRHRQPSPYLRHYTRLILGLWIVLFIVVRYYPQYLQPSMLSPPFSRSWEALGGLAWARD